MGSQPRQGHIRDAFINSALDETLARAIFNDISNSKAHHAFPLEYVTLHPNGGGEFGRCVSLDVSCLKQAIHSLSRKWLLTRSPRDDSCDKVIAREIGKRSREEWDNRKLHPLIQAAWLKTEPLFRRIWPEMENGIGVRIGGTGVGIGIAGHFQMRSLEDVKASSFCRIRYL